MIRTCITGRETALLKKLACGQVVYEAGCLLGYSTIELARVAERVIAVDPHNGYPKEKPRPTWDRFVENIRPYADRIVPVCDIFQRVPIPPDVTMAWADLTGEEDLTWEFLRQAHDVPIVGIHDYSRAGCSGATAAVDRYIRLCRPHIVRVDTLIILEKRRMK